MRKKIFSIIFILGFCVFLSQIIIIRELFAIFYGNELTLGIIFFFWLLGNGAGSYASKKTLLNPSSIMKNLPAVFIICQILLFFALFTIIFLLKSNMILNIPLQGEIIGLGTMLLNSFIFITPFCLLTGFLFPAACQILNDLIKEPARSAGYTYMLDASGACAAGIIGNFFMIKYLSVWHIVFIIGAILLFNCLLIYYLTNNKYNNILAIIFSCIGLSIFIYDIPNYLNGVNNKLRWRGYNILENRSSLYGQITVLKKEDNISFYYNGLYAFTYPDRLSAEEVHLTALQNTAAKNVLLIGGGFNGSLAELLKYKNITGIIYVELDPLITGLAIKLLPEDAVPFKYDKKISIINTDARAFVKNSLQKFDFVIMNLPEPYTSSLNRFYTTEFFSEVKEILSPEGIFSLTLPSGENYISPEQKRLLGTTYHTLRNVFSEVKVIPGGTNIFLSSPSKGHLTFDSSILRKRLKTENLDLLYLSSDQIPFRLSQDRIDQLNLQLQPIQTLNKDLLPVNYFHDLLLWASRISNSLVGFIYLLERIFTIENILGAVFLAGILMLLPAKTIKADFIPLAIMSAGFTGISLELIMSLIFQIKTGYLYFQLGMIIASFMLGLACGSYSAAKSLKEIKDPNSAFIYLFLTLSLYPLFIIVLFYFFLKNTKDINILVFLAILFIPSFIIGGLFPIAGILSPDKTDEEKTFGKIFAYDLFGAAFGSLLTTALFIPLIGIYSTLVVVASVNLAVLSVLTVQNTSS